MRQCVFMYMYRDGANYKAMGELLLDGTLKTDEVDLLRSGLEGGEWFIAEQIGVPTLYEALRTSCTSGKSAELDHAWHEFVGVREAAEADWSRLSVWGISDDLLRRIRSIDEWRPDLSENWHL